MVKKLILLAVVAAGVMYASGYDFASLRRHIVGTANTNARGFTAESDGGWGDNSGY